MTAPRGIATRGARRQPPEQFFLACRRVGIVPTRFLVAVDIGTQTMSLFEAGGAGRAAALAGLRFGLRHYEFMERFRCSTSRFGVGQMLHSNCTPLGLHRIAEKIGGGWPVGTVFRSRRPVGFTWKGLPCAPITNRIFWLEGLESGVNRGGNVDSHERYIYIHGTGDEPTLGKPASHGCIHLAARDLFPLYDKIPTGTLVWIG